MQAGSDLSGGLGADATNFDDLRIREKVQKVLLILIKSTTRASR